MNENHLLHNETAKKLYFEYARELPIINLCSQDETGGGVYSNISEAFLLNDAYKLDAMRQCGVDERYITGDASDFEKFKCFCEALPKFAGHPLYFIAHTELKEYFNCDIEIKAENAEILWRELNGIILKNGLSDKKLIEDLRIQQARCFYFDHISELERDEISDLSALEGDLKARISEEDALGCRLAKIDVIHGFMKPNPYSANEVIKKLKLGQKLTLDECDLLEMQITRTLCGAAKDRDWSLLVPAYDRMNEEVISYLISNDLKPRFIPCFVFEADDSITDIEAAMRMYCSNYPIGKSFVTVYLQDKMPSYAKHDYLRRCVCTVIGKWVEDGEYTDDDQILKRLIEDIFYNNLKEAIS